MKSLSVSMLEVATAISTALDLFAQTVSSHQRRVAWTSRRIALGLHLSPKHVYDVTLAGLMHDIGIISSHDRPEVRALDFGEDAHAQIGAALLALSGGFRALAPLVEQHHAMPDPSPPWEDRFPYEQQLAVLQLSDILEQHLSSWELAHPLDSFNPERLRQNEMYRRFPAPLIDAAILVLRDSSYWAEMKAGVLPFCDCPDLRGVDAQFDIDALEEVAQLFGALIDLRCSYAITHSYAVAAVAERIGELAGLPRARTQKLRIAGYLHDIGKLALPVPLLMVPPPLNDIAWEEIHAHPALSQRILETIHGMEEIASWCGAHHESLDGSGYPRGLSGTGWPEEAQILAMADRLVAMQEDRPWRAALPAVEVDTVLAEDLAGWRLSPQLVALIRTRFTDIDTTRAHAHAAERRLLALVTEIATAARLPQGRAAQ